MIRMKPWSPLFRIHSFLNVSEANGPGRRAVIWFQGCTRKCPGCCNWQMQSVREGRWVPGHEIVGWLVNAKKEKIEGITLTGGEPMRQPEAAISLIMSARKLGLTSVLYTGYEEAEATESWRTRRLWYLADVVVAGPYDASKPDSERPVGSMNKRLIFRRKYSYKDLDRWGRFEIQTNPDGYVIQTGIPPAMDLVKTMASYPD